MLLKGRIFKIVAIVVLVTFSNIILQPAIAAANPKHPTTTSTGSAKPTAMEKYAQVLSQLEALANGDYHRAGLDHAKAKALAAHPEEAPGVLQQLIRELQALEPEVDTEWKATEAHLKKHGIAQEILNRHFASQKLFKSKQAKLKKLALNVEAASRLKGESLGQSSAYQKLAKFLKDERRDVKRRPIDPSKLPFRSPDAKVREPIEEAGKLKDFLAEQEKKAFEERTKELSWAKGAKSGKPADLKESFAPMAYRELSKSTPPGDEDLAETIDVQITQAIRDKAAELGGKPVEIYEWVKNNIRFIPTYGSIQGSEMTLQTMRGNAFDTASLLIALLRSSGIPARYVYGTIELSADRVMNWVGGVTTPEVAQDVLGMGGIPNVGLISGGKVTAIRMEHVWVEAYVDYFPSRGARHKQGDTWIPLDASFKRYTYTQGMNFQQDVPFDAQNFADQAKEGATINEEQRWVQNFNQTAMGEQATQYKNRVTTYLEESKPNATVGDLIGAQTIVAENYPYLLGTLPYEVKVTASRYSGLPDSLRHKFRYSLYGSWTYIESLPKLAGKKVTLSFVPATQADQDLIASYLPKPHTDGTPVRPEELPRSLPAYIHVLSQLRVEGEVAASGGPFKLGDELTGLGGFTRNDLSGWDLTSDYSLIAGQVTAIGLSLQGMSPAPLEKLKEKLEQTKAKLEASDLTGLTAEHLIGDLLTACMWGYFVSVEMYGRTVQAQYDMIDLPGLSYGLLHSKVIPIRSFFGVTTSVRFPGLEMDIGHLRDIRVSKDNSRETVVNYNKVRGIHASMMEAVAPAQSFTDRANPAEGISAVTGIVKAAQQGQKIFTITQANQDMTLPQLSQSAGVMGDVYNALAQGMEVTISQGQITCDGWTGVGYIITDPNTGAGAYLIEGGGNGAWVHILFWTVMIELVLLAILVAPYLAALLTVWIIPIITELIDALASLIVNAFMLSTYSARLLSVLLGMGGRACQMICWGVGTVLGAALCYNLPQWVAYPLLYIVGSWAAGCNAACPPV